MKNSFCILLLIFVLPLSLRAGFQGKGVDSLSVTCDSLVLDTVKLVGGDYEVMADIYVTMKAEVKGWHPFDFEVAVPPGFPTKVMFDPKVGDFAGDFGSVQISCDSAKHMLQLKGGMYVGPNELYRSGNFGRSCGIAIVITDPSKRTVEMQSALQPSLSVKAGTMVVDGFPGATVISLEMWSLGGKNLVPRRRSSREWDFSMVPKGAYVVSVQWRDGEGREKVLRRKLWIE